MSLFELYLEKNLCSTTIYRKASQNIGKQRKADRLVVDNHCTQKQQKINNRNNNHSKEGETNGNNDRFGSKSNDAQKLQQTISGRNDRETV